MNTNNLCLMGIRTCLESKACSLRVGCLEWLAHVVWSLASLFCLPGGFLEFFAPNLRASFLSRPCLANLSAERNFSWFLSFRFFVCRG